MNFQLFGYGITFHFYRRGEFHVCEFKECPSRLAPAEIKYVIANRIVGSYSEPFDSRKDAERALRYFAPIGFSDSFGLGKRYEILESAKLSSDPEQWIIADPEVPESAGLLFVNTRHLQYPDIQEHGCTSCRACEVSHCRICAPCGKPEPPPKGVSSKGQRT